ncbi:hypothetical protein, partial [Amycolatopsis pigmentata]
MVDTNRGVCLHDDTVRAGTSDETGDCMVTRTQRLIDRSRAWLDRWFRLQDDPQASRHPLVIEGEPAPETVRLSVGGLPVPVDDTLAAVCANVAL